MPSRRVKLPQETVTLEIDIVYSDSFLQRSIENSKSPYSGMARTNMEKGSLGVMRAERSSITTKAYFLNPFICCRFIIPIVERTSITVGNSKSKPIRNTIEKKSDMYEPRVIVFAMLSLTV